MKNSIAEGCLNSCMEEINIIKKDIDNNKLARVNKFLIQYAIICASASIEVAVKTIISDQVQIGANENAKNYLNKAIRNNSMNPSYSKIQQLMNEINPKWKKDLLEQVRNHPNKDRITSSLDNIVKNRNGISHGRGANASIENVVQWLNDAINIVKIIDSVVDIDNN
ncbi:HEPN domain-containing protein [Clostridium sporogenes]|nr:HEPN domain-containing protein [Clostridium sporogenes]EHN13432.1 hypothetical protein IYC_18055 [Clostridium sporogenes PA 3679]MDU4596909.1 HEPN domain-containing protein [Clostridium sporogenes]NFQ33519.1 hypothetical protein [Clostridium sporogenes]NFQ59066.1 hypothetical protein [Clostridium sporogenes]NFU09114.1 hypothetical protein [Clostridium sporogenes]